MLAAWTDRAPDVVTHRHNYLAFQEKLFFQFKASETDRQEPKFDLAGPAALIADLRAPAYLVAGSSEKDCGQCNHVSELPIGNIIASNCTDIPVDCRSYSQIREMLASTTSHTILYLSLHIESWLARSMVPSRAKDTHTLPPSASWSDDDSIDVAQYLISHLCRRSVRYEANRDIETAMT